MEGGALPDAKRATLAEVVSGTVRVPQQGLVVFKPVGTALQDLALAVRYYELLKGSPGVDAPPGLAKLKRPAWV